MLCAVRSGTHRCDGGAWGLGAQLGGMPGQSITMSYHAPVCPASSPLCRWHGWAPGPSCLASETTPTGAHMMQTASVAVLPCLFTAAWDSDPCLNVSIFTYRCAASTGVRTACPACGPPRSKCSQSLSAGPTWWRWPRWEGAVRVWRLLVLHAQLLLLPPTTCNHSNRVNL